MESVIDDAVPIPGLPGWLHAHRAVVTSTNALLLDAARDSGADRIWLTGGLQTAGRARRGRQWVSPNDNLYASVLLMDPAPQNQLGSFPLVCALAAHDAITTMLPIGMRDAVRIKWPNDILICAGKCAGLLVETGVTTDGKQAVIAGFGVNCASAPEGTPYPATTLRDHGGKAQPKALFASLSHAFAARLSQWRQGTGFAELRSQWLERSAGLGETIKVNLPKTSMRGRFVTIDADGFLVLEDADQSIHKIAAGDVFL